MPEGFALDDDEEDCRSAYMLTLGQMAWRRNKISTDFRGDTSLFDQEYPASPEVAFASSSPRALIKATLVARARRARDVEALGPKIMAVDPAEYGDDQTSVMLRQGRVAKRLGTWGDTGTMETVGKVGIWLQLPAALPQGDLSGHRLRIQRLRASLSQDPPGALCVPRAAPNSARASTPRNSSSRTRSCSRNWRSCSSRRMAKTSPTSSWSRSRRSATTCRQPTGSSRLFGPRTRNSPRRTQGSNGSRRRPCLPLRRSSRRPRFRRKCRKSWTTCRSCSPGSTTPTRRGSPRRFAWISNSEQELLTKATSGDIADLTHAEVVQIAELNDRLGRTLYAQHDDQLKNLQGDPNLQGLGRFYKVPPLPPARKPRGSQGAPTVSNW